MQPLIELAAAWVATPAASVCSTRALCVADQVWGGRQCAGVIAISVLELATLLDF